MIRNLPRIIAGSDREPQDRREHPMRLVTEGVARDSQTWTPERAGDVRRYFDGLAGEWNQRFVDAPLRTAPVEDALARGNVERFGRCLDLGSGTGLEAPLLAAAFASVIAVDLSFGMLADAPSVPPRVQADGARLPFADDTFDAVVLVNAFLFGAEMARVLGPGGTIVWVSSVGADTPIYLAPAEVVAALGGEWDGVESEAGDGTWFTARRSVG
jgi:SAM-dependent methyltransferase